MPSAVIKSFSQQSGKTESEVEKLYKKAKDIVKGEYGISKEQSEKYYALVIGILKKMLGINKAIMESVEVCELCHELLDEESSFCGYCGSKLYDFLDKNDEEPDLKGFEQQPEVVEAVGELKRVGVKQKYVAFTKKRIIGSDGKRELKVELHGGKTNNTENFFNECKSFFRKNKWEDVKETNDLWYKTGFKKGNTTISFSNYPGSDTIRVLIQDF